MSKNDGGVRARASRMMIRKRGEVVKVPMAILAIAKSSMAVVQVNIVVVVIYIF